MLMSPRYHNKTVEEYRQLAEKCREIARMVSAEKERADLLARADTWELIAERVGRAQRQAPDARSAKHIGGCALT
jgi:hypothetical protein